MSTHVPRPPHSDDELRKLYPESLKLQLVQVLLRHGERTPVSSRFRNAGLPPYWAYCNAARRMKSVLLASGGQWDTMEYQRRLETFGPDDSPTAAEGPSGELDGICNPGELTDRGRETTLALGQRLRHLYVDQLRYMPPLIADADMIYLRATPIPRALESMQQVFSGLYPPSARTADFPPPTIMTRSPADETLYPNDGNCRRFAQLGREFAQRTADRWNDSTDMKYLNKVLGKWMPASSPRIAVDSHPRLSGIMDTINATKAHGPATRLPREFYDDKADAIIDRINVEEWYSGYMESREYRMLGIGSLMGDIVGRMVGSAGHSGSDGLDEVGSKVGAQTRGRGGETSIKFGLSGCHDTTLAGVLSSLGAFEGEKWPPFTSHIAFELFKQSDSSSALPQSYASSPATGAASSRGPPKPMGWWGALFERADGPPDRQTATTTGTVRKPLQHLAATEADQLEGYFVRIKYNDRVMQVPACKLPGNHFEQDESLCTLRAFKSVVDKYTPQHWKQACNENLDRSAFPAEPEPAGY